VVEAPYFDPTPKELNLRCNSLILVTTTPTANTRSSFSKRKLFKSRS